MKSCEKRQLKCEEEDVNCDTSTGMMEIRIQGQTAIPMKMKRKREGSGDLHRAVRTTVDKRVIEKGERVVVARIRGIIGSARVARQSDIADREAQVGITVVQGHDHLVIIVVKVE